MNISEQFNFVSRPHLGHLDIVCPLLKYFNYEIKIYILREEQSVFYTELQQSTFVVNNYILYCIFVTSVLIAVFLTTFYY